MTSRTAEPATSASSTLYFGPWYPDDGAARMSRTPPQETAP